MTSAVVDEFNETRALSSCLSCHLPLTSLSLLAMKVNAPLRPGFLHKLLLAELLSSRANLNCDRLRQTSLEYSQPGKSRQTKLEMESREKENTRV